MTNHTLNREKIIRLLYFSAFSQEFPTAEPAQDTEIAQIMCASIPNNRANAITGFLLMHHRWFIQALEGPSAAVMATYQRINKDRRHEGVTLVAVGDAECRIFSNWNMCARRLSDVDDAILQTLGLNGSFMPQSLSAATTLHLLSIVTATISVHRLGQQNAIAALRREMVPK